MNIDLFTKTWHAIMVVREFAQDPVQNNNNLCQVQVQVFTLCSFWFELSPFCKMRSVSPAPPSEVNVTKDDVGASADFDSDAPLNEDGIPADENHGAFGDALEMPASHWERKRCRKSEPPLPLPRSTHCDSATAARDQK